MSSASSPTTAMILAAGMGTRMRPLTDTRPKALVPLGGRPLIEHALVRLREAGVERVVVNAHHHAEQLIAYLSGRDRIETHVSDEREKLLETGGGIAKALPLLGEARFYAVNGDVVWLDGVANTLRRLAQRWDESAMDALLLLQLGPDTIGYSGLGDFTMEADGLLRRRREREVAPYVHCGIQLLHPRLFRACPSGAFSLNLLYDRALAAGRLWGLRHDGLWLHVGTRAGLSAAEAALARL